MCVEQKVILMDGDTKEICRSMTTKTFSGYINTLDDIITTLLCCRSKGRRQKHSILAEIKENKFLSWFINFYEAIHFRT